MKFYEELQLKADEKTQKRKEEFHKWLNSYIPKIKESLKECILVNDSGVYRTADCYISVENDQIYQIYSYGAEEIKNGLSDILAIPKTEILVTASPDNILIIVYL
jgi:hypothetical protein